MSTWREILRSDLADLAHGRVSDNPRRFQLPVLALGAIKRAPRILRRLDLYYVISILARLVKCNAPLVPGLTAAAASAPSWRLVRVLRILAGDIAQGMHLHEAMRCQPKVFPAHFADMVQAAHDSGSLGQTIDEILVSIVERKRIHYEWRTVTGYLAVVLTLFTLLTTFINIKVMPCFFEIQDELHKQAGNQFTPGAIQNLYAEYWPWLSYGTGFSALLLLLFSLRRGNGILFARWPRLRRLAGRLALGVPMLRSFVINANLTQSTKVLAQLAAAGYPLDIALESAASGGSINPRFAAAFRRMSNQLRLGFPFSVAAQKELPLLPKSFSATAALGEYHGEMPEALNNLAETYRLRQIKQLQLVKPFVFPILIAAIGLLVFTTCFIGFTSIWAMTDIMIATM